jgi:hypothetical protein
MSAVAVASTVTAVRRMTSSAATATAVPVTAVWRFESGFDHPW